MAVVPARSAGVPEAVISSQAAFRTVMDAMAHPGSVQRINGAAAPPAPLLAGTAAIALALFDQDTSIWLDARMAATRDVETWIKFHTSAPLAKSSSDCAFAIVGDGATLPALDRFSFGTDDYPDRSTTLIIQVPSLNDGPPVIFHGPGINGAAILRAALSPPDLLERLSETHVLFPCGIDLILVAGDAIAAIPRTTRFTAMEG